MEVIPITMDDVRHFLLDRDASDNFLLDDVEFEDGQIEKGMQNTVDRFNSTLPLVLVSTVDQFPFRAEMLMGTTAYLLRSQGINMKRNELLTKTAGGTQTIEAKSEAYFNLASAIYADLDQRFARIKISYNAEQCYNLII